MKRIFQLFASLAAILLCQAALAAPAKVAELTGSAQAVPGAGSPRDLRKGDDVNQGETVVTSANSNLVLQFEDGQIVALTQNSRLTVSAYVYDKAEPAKSNVLLSLIGGGMRAITGLIGKQRPTAVAYRAGNATIGIRGTDVTVGTVAGNLVITVVAGEIAFTFQGKTTSVKAGEGVDARTDGTVRKAAVAALFASLPPELKAIFNDADKIQLERIIKQAGQQDLRDNAPAPSKTNSPGTSNNNAGGGASTR